MLAPATLTGGQTGGSTGGLNGIPSNQLLDPLLAPHPTQLMDNSRSDVAVRIDYMCSSLVPAQKSLLFYAPQA